MKKSIALLTALCLLMLTGCQSSTSKPETSPDSSLSVKYTAGTYEASSPGMGGEVPVTVTFTEDAIESIVVGENGETEGLGTLPLEQLPEKIIAQQSLAVDIVSGATISSNALLAAVKDCVEQAGGDVEALSKKSDDSADKTAEDLTVDIVIAGGGAAGLTAGAYAKYAGVENVLLLEKLSFCGGSTALSGGVITRSADENDPENRMTADEMYDYFYSISGGQVPDENLRQYVDESPALWNWFTSLEGGEVAHPYPLPENTFSTFPDGGGQGLANTLLKEAEKAGVDIQTNVDVQSLIQDETGKILGVQCINADKAKQNIYAKAVILATGGFANNQELLVRFAGTNAGNYVERKGAGGADGDGILMGEAVGAALHFGDNWDTSGMNNKWITTSKASHYYMQMYGLMLNDEGQRFVREDHMLPRIFEEMVNQLNAGHTGGFHIIMTQEGFLKAGATEAEIEASVANGELTKCDSIEALAETTGIDRKTLETVIADYTTETSDDFGKDEKYLGYFNAEGPFYTTLSHPVRSGTMGGLMINTASEVLDTDGNAIPGLFAAGETANGTFFDNYYYICGNMNMHALITGKAAGNSAAALCK